MTDYLSFWFAKFLMDLFITVGFIFAVILIYGLHFWWVYGRKKNNKLQKS